MAETVHYWAESLFTSRTFYVNVAAMAVLALQNADVLQVIPQAAMPKAMAVLAVLNIILRYVTVRPVALIAPGEVKVIAVPKIDPPTPGAVTN